MIIEDVKIKWGPFRITVTAKRIQAILVDVIWNKLVWKELEPILAKAGVPAASREKLLIDIRQWLTQAIC